MKSRILTGGAERTFALVCERGEDAVPCLKKFAQEARLAASRLTAIGAFRSAVVGFFDQAQRDYRRIVIPGQVEVLSLVGDITFGAGDDRQVHVHAVLGTESGDAKGGHLLSGIVDTTLEVIITEAPAHLRRRIDAATGLALIDLDQP